MESFKLAAVVLPATDGLLSSLGYDVKALGPLAFGVITEEGSRRSHVHFPELKLSLWQEHTELKDVEVQLLTNPEFAVLKKYFVEKPSDMLLPIVMSFLMKSLRATFVLGLDHGVLEDVWEESPAKLNEYFQGSVSVPVFRLSLGLEELNPREWELLRTGLGAKLLLERFLPSGMYKFELSLYLRR